MSVKIFRLEGTYQKQKQTYRFSKEIRALTEAQANEQLFSILGSCHGVTRKAINIEQINEISPSDAETHLIRKLSGIE